jgi:hypothetical protein
MLKCKKCGGPLTLEMKDKVLEVCEKCGFKEEIPFFELEDVPYKSRAYFPKEDL